MWKRILLIFSLLSLSLLSNIAQENETQTFVISESELNAFIDEQANQRNLEIHLTASLKGGLVMINLVGTRPNGNEFNLELAMIASLNYERIEWTVVDWTVTDADGNELDVDEERFYPTIENFLGRWRELSAQLFRSKVSELPPQRIENIEIIEGQIMFETLTGEPTGEDSPNNLPSNITDNGDGTFTITISQDMINDAFAVIVERNENLSNFTVEIEGINAGQFRVTLQAKALCNNEVIEGLFNFTPYGEIPSLDDSNEQFIIGDWNGDGFDDIASIFIPGRTYAVLHSSMVCEGEAFTQEQNARVMSLLLPAVQRFVRLQTRNSIIVDFRVVGSSFEITVEPPQR